MTDSEYRDISRLLDSLTKGADTLRVVFSKKTVEDKEMAIRTGGVITTRDVFTDEAKAHPDFKRRYFLLPNREINALVALINGCDDWTSEKHKASALYKKMRAFISASSGMPIGISDIYKSLPSNCLELMDLIVGRYPDLVDGQSSPTVQEEEDNPVSQEPPIVQEDTALVQSSKTGRCKKLHINVDVKVLEEKLSKYFNNDFKTPRSGESNSRFKQLCYGMASPASAYTITSWARIAYDIKMNCRFREPKFTNGDFTKFMTEFFGIIGLRCPPKPKMAHYSDTEKVSAFINLYLR